MQIDQEFHKMLLKVLADSKVSFQLAGTFPNSQKENEEIIKRIEEAQKSLIMLNLNQD